MLSSDEDDSSEPEDNVDADAIDSVDTPDDIELIELSSNWMTSGVTGFSVLLGSVTVKTSSICSNSL